jgi:hypothetical protein
MGTRLFFLILSLGFLVVQEVGAVEIDLGSDQVPEIITGSGPDQPPLVTVQRLDGSVIGSFAAYDANMRDGVTVAACDLTGDGIPEIITGTMFGGGPHVRVFNNFGKPTGLQFMAYEESFQGGVFVACGDADKDGVAEIITGAGLSGGPRVKWFDKNGALLKDYFAGEVTDNRGVQVDFINGELLTSPGDSTHAYLNLPISNHRDQDSIIVDRSRQLLTYFDNGVPVKRFSVSTGRRFFETPLGETTVSKKIAVKDYYWPGAYLLEDVYWNLQFRQHLYIHTAYWHNKFGTPMSSGCVNMREAEAKWLYDRVDIDTPVIIAE